MSLYFYNARVLDPATGRTYSTVRVDRGRIAGLDVPPRRGDLQFDLDEGAVLPGLINAHDHLELNNFGRTKYREWYNNASEWTHDMTGRLGSDPAILAARHIPLADRLYFGGLKNLLSGATCVSHHNPIYPPLKRRFPVHVITPCGWAHSLYLSPDFADSYRRTPPNVPWVIHLAEGTDDQAAAELGRLAAAGALASNTVLVHAVGLTGADRRRIEDCGAAVVWCPSSNKFLLNATAHVSELSCARRVAIGSDSRLTGERDLLDELRIASETEELDAAAMLAAVTADAARIFRVDAGRVQLGARADLMVGPPGRGPLELLGRVRRADLRAVLIDGAIRVADAEFEAAMRDARRITLDGRDKRLARDIADRAARLAVREAGLEMAA
jgi:cytosine/adenosine deaminase-related metal-dependent hydrolase